MRYGPSETKSALPFALILLSLLLLLIVPQMADAVNARLEEELSEVIEPASTDVDALEAMLLVENAATREYLATRAVPSLERLREVRAKREEMLRELVARAPLVSGETARALHSLQAEVERLQFDPGAPAAIIAPDPEALQGTEAFLLDESPRAAIGPLRSAVDAAAARRQQRIDETRSVGELLTALLFGLGIVAALVVFRLNQRTLRLAHHADRVSRERTALLESTGEGTFGTDLDGICTFINPAGAAMLGYHPSELVGTPIDAVIHGRRAVESEPYSDACPIRRTLRTGEGIRAEDEVFWTRDGRSIPVEYGVFPLVAGSEVRGVVVNFLDITWRKDLEREREGLLAREQAARSRAERAETHARFLAEASDCFAQSLDYETTLRSLARVAVPAIADSYIVYLLGDKGQVQRAEPTHADPAMQTILQERLRQHPPALETLIPPVRDALQRGSTTRMANVSAEALQSVPGDAEHASIFAELQLRSLIVVPLRARDRILGAMSLGSSIPGRFDDPDARQLAEELATRAALAIENAQLYRTAQQAVQAREEVIGIVSHDLRSPLSTVQMGAKALLRHRFPGSDNEMVRRQLEVIGLSAERMHRLVHDLLDLVRIDGGQLQIEAEPTNAEELLTEVIAAMEPIAAEKGVSLELGLPPRLPPLMIDGGRVHQVFTNLLSNAVKFTPPGGTVTVTAALQHDDLVRLDVIDTGCGIPAAHLPLLFDRYWQASARRDRGGIGLGLAIVKGIVEGHGGTVSVASREGEGSSFSFTLPVCGTALITPVRLPHGRARSNLPFGRVRSGSTG